MSLRNRNSLLYLFLLLNVLILLLLQNDQINQNSFLQVQIYLPNQTHADTLTQHQPDTIMNPTQFPPTGPLTKWFQTRMETLLTTTPARSQQPPSITESYPVEPETQADFKSLFYTAFHPDAKITMNHQQVSQEDFIRQMEQSTMGLGPGGVQVDWRDILEIPSSDNQGQSAYGHEVRMLPRCPEQRVTWNRLVLWPGCSLQRAPSNSAFARGQRNDTASTYSVLGTYCILIPKIPVIDMKPDYTRASR